MRLSDSEWMLMQALWERWPATAAELRSRADRGWAHTTVKTMLTRLVEKGAVRETRQGQAVRYEPLISREEARRTAVRSLLDRVFGGAVGPLLHQLAAEEQVSPADRARLERLARELEEAEAREGGPP